MGIFAVVFVLRVVFVFFCFWGKVLIFSVFRGGLVGVLGVIVFRVGGGKYFIFF